MQNSQSKLTVSKADEGVRLDKYLAYMIPSQQRLVLKGLINSERVKVNGEIEFHPQYRVKVGDAIEVDFDGSSALPAHYKSIIRPQKLEFKVIYEDKELLVIDKPSGMAVQPGTSQENGTLSNGVKYYLQSKNEYVWGENKTGLLHRLDKDTSGVIMFVKTPRALSELADKLSKREIEKSYLAVVAGKFPDKAVLEDSAIIDKPSQTKLSLVDILQEGKYSVVLAKPLTGRKHQIRVHLLRQGYPIVGDKNYHGEAAPRMMLHAWKLKFEWRGKVYEFTAPPPAEFLGANRT